MADKTTVTNVVFAGLGGQGVLKASDILAEAAFQHGYDVKKAEIHGMSQRGGSVSSDVRFGEEVLSPMVPVGEADILVVLDSTQVEPNIHQLRHGGTLITPEAIVGESQSVEDATRDTSTPLSRQNFNVALLGTLSYYLDIAESTWQQAVCAYLPAKVHEQNIEVFRLGRAAASRNG